MQMANQSTAILPNQKVHTDLDAGKLYSFIKLVNLQLYKFNVLGPQQSQKSCT